MRPRSVTSRTAAETRTPSSVSSDESEISTGEFGAVFPPRRQRQARPHRTGGGIREVVRTMTRVHLSDAIGHEHVDRMTDEFQAVVAEEQFGLAVHEMDKALCVDRHNRIGRGFE
jgi:hypothetical protein